MREVKELLQEWQDANVLTAAAAKKIAAYEASRAPAPAKPGGVEPTRTSALSEVLGYVGAALAVIAIGFILGSQWDSLAYAARLALVVGLTAVVAGAGFAMWRSPSAAAQRVVSILTVAAVAGVGWIAWLVVRGDVDQYDWIERDWSGLGVGVAVVAAAVPLYLYRRRALPLVTMLITLTILTGAIVAAPAIDGRFEWVAASWWVIGALAFAGGLRRVLAPPVIGVVFGSVIALIGVQAGSFGDWRLGFLIGGVATSLVFAGYAVAQRGTLSVLIPGAIGLLFFIPQLIQEIFEDGLLTWVAVLVTGLGLVVGSVLLVRERKPRGA